MMTDGPASPNNVNLTVDGIATTVPKGTPLLKVIRGLGLDVPTLCNHPMIEPYGVCRLCTVEVIRGRRRRLVTSCNYPAQDGISVLTRSERVLKGRRLIAELLLARCPGVKEVQDIASSLEVEQTRFQTADEKCVLCGLCVQVCRDVVGASVLTFEGRGPERRVTTAFDESSDRCIECGACALVCPTGHIRMVDETGLALSQDSLSLGPNSAIAVPFMQAVPRVPVIDKSRCIHFATDACGTCKAACEKQAIDYSQQDELVELDVGNIILATGWKPFDCSRMSQYGYGRLPNVFTSLEFERMCNAAGTTGGKILLRDGKTEPETVAIVHCVGSRDTHYNSYCSNICCMAAMKFGHLVLEKTNAEVYSFYIDLRAAQKGYEEFYQRLLSERMHFIRAKVSEVTDAGRTPFENGKLIVQAEDTLLGRQRRVPVDMVILMGALEPQEDAAELARKCSISCGDTGWFTERHPKLDPVATATDGIFVAGVCQGPKDIPASVTQGAAAAARVQGMIARGRVTIEPIGSSIDEQHCSGCRICASQCPYHAISYVEEKQVSTVNGALCKGCGTCVSACPAGAITSAHFTDRQILAELEGILSNANPSGVPVEFAFATPAKELLAELV